MEIFRKLLRSLIHILQFFMLIVVVGIKGEPKVLVVLRKTARSPL